VPAQPRELATRETEPLQPPHLPGLEKQPQISHSRDRQSLHATDSSPPTAETWVAGDPAPARAFPEKCQPPPDESDKSTASDRRPGKVCVRRSGASPR